jgi:hypothetical protein
MAKEDWLDRLFALYDLLMLGPSAASGPERENARRLLENLLESHGKTLDDLPELLATVQQRRARSAPRRAPPTGDRPSPTGDPPSGNLLFNVILAVLRQFLSLEPDEYVAVTLWAMLTHLARRFMHTPRLVLRSGVRGCGKTTCLDVLNGLVAYPQKSDNMTAASFVRLTDLGDGTWGPTLLIDEVDNLGLLTDPFFRAALNSGHRQGGSVQRTIQNVVVTFKTFAPVVLAGIGTVPLPLARRSVVIHLQRDPQAPLHLERFDRLDAEQTELFLQLTANLARWAQDCTLARDPPMPTELTGSQADNWRPLIAIADACGVGEIAREVAIRMSRDLDEDLEIVLLRDIRDFFAQKRVDRVASAALVDHLNALPHGLWADWRGKNNTDTQRPLTAAIMAKLLAVFRIRPVTVWPLGRNADSKSSRGYRRDQFADAWRRYCPEPEADTPSQPSKISQLRGD